MKKILITTILLIANAQGAILTLSQGNIEFNAKGKPALISIDGTSELLNGILKSHNNQFDGEFDLELTSLNTGIELRDDHLKNKYLEVEKFPKAKLTFKNIKIERNSETNFKANLMLHGQENEVNGIALLSDQNELMAEFTINLADFGIEIPSFQGITVAKEVKIKVNGIVE